LAAFLFLMVPFAHGMIRYFNIYVPCERPQPYHWFLLLDTAGFIIEAALFFVLSRSMNEEQWQRFYFTVLMLLVVDVVWGSLASAFHPPRLWPWVFVNLATIPVLAFARCHWRGTPHRGPLICMGILFLRMIADYGFSFDFYFPTQPPCM
jgi:hypothetical protein